jgi:chromosomal replication initiation ATPase DnaA
MALAVMLAAHVPEDARIGKQPPMSNRRQLDTAVRFVADAFDTTPAAILSPSRRRNDVDARSVAMAALRWAGHTTAWIGGHLGRDHTTVVHATGRVGEDARLRAVAHELVERLGGFNHTIEEVA